MNHRKMIKNKLILRYSLMWFNLSPVGCYSAYWYRLTTF